MSVTKSSDNPDIVEIAIFSQKNGVSARRFFIGICSV